MPRHAPVLWRRFGVRIPIVISLFGVSWLRSSLAAALLSCMCKRSRREGERREVGSGVDGEVGGGEGGGKQRKLGGGGDGDDDGYGKWW